jgi:hypothetical protein
MQVELSIPCEYVPRPKAEFRPFVYGLVDPLNLGHVRYVGMALQGKRPFAHAKRARKDSGNYPHVLNWIRSLQGRDYTVLVLEELPAGSRRRFVGAIETMYITSLKAIGHDLTNATNGGDGFIGGKHRPESRARLAATWARKKAEGYAPSPEHCQAISDGKKGIPLGPKSPEALATQVVFQVGHEVSADTRKRISEKLQGHAHTAETRKLISETLKGRPLSAEHAANKHAGQLTPKARQRQRESHLGVKMSPESSEAKSKAMRGQVFTDEHRAALKEAWTRRKSEKNGN